MIPDILPLYLIIFLFGIVIGSFLNVCICRVPAGQSVVNVRSHCMSCGYQLKWQDLIPIFSYLFLRGKCRKCGRPISVQYPLVEAANGILYVLVFAVNGWNVQTLLYCLAASALLALSVIDFRTYEIPVGFNIFILTLGLIQLLLDLGNWLQYCIGFLIVSAFLWMVYAVTRGRGIGGGDIKLMAACGLLLGFPKIVMAFLAGCILGSVIHILRMKISGAGRVLAMGPYLSIGALLSMLWGDTFLNWYRGLF